MYSFKTLTVMFSLACLTESAQQNQHPVATHGLAGHANIFHHQPIPHGGFIVHHPPTVYNGFDHVIPHHHHHVAAAPRVPQQLFTQKATPQHSTGAEGFHGFGYDINFSSPKELAADAGHVILHHEGATSPLGAAHIAPLAPRGHKGHFVPGSAHVTVKGTPHSYNYNVKQTHGKDGTSYVWAGGDYTHKGHAAVSHGGQAY